MFVPILIYSAKIWTVSKNQRQTRHATEMKALRKISYIRPLGWAKNKEIRKIVRVKPVEKVKRSK